MPTRRHVLRGAGLILFSGSLDVSAEDKTADKPMLADLVRAGDQQSEAVAITDFIFMAKDISNAYLINTADGDLLVNTGFMDNAARTKTLLAAKRSGPLRRIILTQAHADHYGGVPVLREAGTAIVAEVCPAGIVAVR